MKRLMVVFCFIFVIATPVLSSASSVGLVINENSVAFTPDTGYPFVDNYSRTQVPLRAAMESFGCVVDWDDKNFCAIVKKDDITLTVPVNCNYILKNGKKIQNDTTSILKDGRIYLPIRVVIEALGGFVGWNSNLNSVTVDTSSPLMQIHFIDVGQGDSSLIDYGTFEILIDAGDNTKGELVSNYIFPYVDGNLDLIIATHPDADHIGGLDTVLSDYVVDRIIDSGYASSTKTYQDYINAVKYEGCLFEYDSNTSISFGDDACLNIIETGDNWTNSNDMSVVCSLVYGKTNVLFTGDISENAESVVANLCDHADVLKVGHHGSKTSSSALFLNKIKPDYSIISVGLNNKYGHPTTEALARLELCGSKILGTHTSGNIILNINMSGYGLNKSNYITVNTQFKQNSSDFYSQYIGNKNSLIFHFESCLSANKMSESNKVFFIYRNDAINSGYIPCKICNP